jgi:hypothetical protein
MTDLENSGPLFPLKDALVALPLVASTLAICWEIGRFSVFGGFLLFTLSEHLLSAMRALPYALVAALYLFASKFTFGRLTARALKKARSYPNGSAITLSISITTIVAMGGISYLASSITMFVVAAGSGVALAVVAMSDVGDEGPDARLTYAAALAAGFVLAVACGIDMARLQLNLPTRWITIVTTKGGPVVGQNVMTGERGMLLYRQEDLSFIFLRNDEIIKLEYPRISLRGRGKTPPAL